MPEQDWYLIASVSRVIPPQLDTDGTPMAAASHVTWLGDVDVPPSGAMLRERKRDAVRDLRQFLRGEGRRGYTLCVSSPVRGPSNASREAAA